MRTRYFLPFLACGLTFATESFETLPAGPLSSQPVECGVLSAQPGHAVVLQKLARTGKKALHIQGGANRTARIELKEPTTDAAQLSLWLQRWTNNGKFVFRIIAETAAGDVELACEQKLRAGGYNASLQAILPAGTSAVRLVCTSAEKGGVLVDDVEFYTGAMKLTSAEFVNPGPQPLLKRAPINAVFSYRMQTTGAADPLEVNCVRLKVSPANAVDEVTIRTGKPERSVDGTIGLKFRVGKVYGKARPAADGTVTIPCCGTLEPGVTELWVDARPSAHVQVGDSITFEPAGIDIAGQVYAEQGAPVSQRVGYLLAVPDAKVPNPVTGENRDCITYRIPGMIRTSNGTMLACFDARYENHLDLSSDIDVAVVRSEDGGRTWTDPVVAMDAGPGKGNGCGDPCILQDTTTGRIWLQALAVHFDRNPCLLRSRPGYDPQDTGQWEMVYSDDDGKTWSSNINITREIKQTQWTTILAGPGCGICTSKGVIVFPAQIWDMKARPACRSTICHSADHGKTWHYGTGVPHRTSECQVVELEDGALMLTCRNETFGGKRVVYTTHDLGKTWQPHSTNVNTLNDPACQASLIAVNSSKYGRLLFFSHPDSKPKLRNHMSIHVSRDDGKTWSKGLVYDVRECWGYSCLALVDDETLGVIYEPAHASETNDYHGMGFLRIPLSEILEMEPLPASKK